MTHQTAMSTRVMCLAHHDKPRKAHAGLRVCPDHRHRALKDLTGIVRLHHELAGLLNAGGGGSAGPVVSVSRDPGLSLDSSVVRARTDLAGCLTAWAAWARRPVPTIIHGPASGPDGTVLNGIRPVVAFPAPPSTGEPRDVAAWIRARIDWYLATDKAGDLCTDLEATLARGRRQRQRNPTSTFTVGECPEPDCNGTLITRLRPADDLLPSEVWCDKAPTDPETGEQIHRWPARDWLTLGRKVNRREAQ